MTLADKIRELPTTKRGECWCDARLDWLGDGRCQNCLHPIAEHPAADQCAVEIDHELTRSEFAEAVLELIEQQNAPLPR